MSSIRSPIILLAALGAVLVVLLAYYYPLLPEQVASHFDVDGVPNGWMSKGAFVGVMVFVSIITAIPIVGLTLALPRMESSINIPNKLYWLAPERREETIAAISSSMIWTECVVMGLLVLLTFFVCRLNVAGTGRLELPMFPTLGVFVAVIGFIVVRLIRKFKNVSDHSTQST
jgi:uncharacterized membrane protein